MAQWLNLVRGLIRPYLAFAFPTAVLIAGIWLIIKFADAELAKSIGTILTTTTVMIIAYYFGERAGKKKEEK